MTKSTYFFAKTARTYMRKGLYVYICISHCWRPRHALSFLCSGALGPDIGFSGNKYKVIARLLSDVIV